MTGCDSGVEVLTRILQTAPPKPGVYQMINDRGEILYIGKAKNLPKRLASYRNVNKLSYRIRNMVSLIKDVKLFTVNSEAEAFLLEANLIKQIQPRFNILLKDDKTYPYILITKHHDFPRITKFRGKIKEEGHYYGPFANVRSINTAITDLQKAFLVRPCSDAYFAARKRVCMEYQIKRCSGPCVNKISKEDYAELIDDVKDFLNGKNRIVQEKLSNKMLEYSQKTEYEAAAALRDRIKALNNLQAKQVIRLDSIKNADVIGLATKDEIACIELCIYRNGQNFGSNAYFLSPVDSDNQEEIIENFLIQFYTDQQIPDTILLPIELKKQAVLRTALNSLSDRKVFLETPIRGDKKILIESAQYNAENSLKQFIVKQIKSTSLFTNIKNLFDLPKLPERIEIYDNSHISGTSRVGAMVVVDKSGFDKKSYRLFNIKSVEIGIGDDYAMMKEVLTRRLAKLLKPQKSEDIWPDLLLIDGGKGQLSTVMSVIENFNLQDKIKVACISKGPDRNAGREKFHMKGREEFSLPMGDPTLHYLQILRDEAHRFAITSHRNKRAKSIRHSKLDDIPLIGKTGKATLIKHFGSIDAIKEATHDQLKKVPGIGPKIAQKIYDSFR